MSFLYKILFLFLIPASSFAQSEDFKSFVADISGTLSIGIRVLMTAIVVVFLWSVFSYLKALSLGDESSAKQYKTHIIWGLVAMFIAVSFWGIVALLQSSFFTESELQNLPEIDRSLPTPG